MKNITITRMTDDDVAEIAELEKKCFAVPWSEKSFHDEMQNKLAVYFVSVSAMLGFGTCRVRVT